MELPQLSRVSWCKPIKRLLRTTILEVWKPVFLLDNTSVSVTQLYDLKNKAPHPYRLLLWPAEPRMSLVISFIIQISLQVKKTPSHLSKETACLKHQQLFPILHDSLDKLDSRLICLQLAVWGLRNSRREDTCNSEIHCPLLRLGILVLIRYLC